MKIPSQHAGIYTIPSKLVGGVVPQQSIVRPVGQQAVRTAFSVHSPFNLGFAAHPPRIVPYKCNGSCLCENSADCLNMVLVDGCCTGGWTCTTDGKQCSCVNGAGCQSTT
jgi:hypothetical protein